MNNINITSARNNNISLHQFHYEEKLPWQCYREWKGTYKIESSTFPVTTADLEFLKQSGVFGYGQIITYKLDDTNGLIYYGGTCDTSD